MKHDRSFCQRKKPNYNLLTALISSVLTIILLTLIMKRLGITPFGNASFASADAQIQYLNFFAYYKDLLSGKNSISYSFSSGLGMPYIGIFAYYLTSPFNLLIVFFNKSDLNTFFSLLVVLKLAMCSITMSVYLNKRFENKIHPLFIILLSLGYALMQYNLSQNLNIMWIDGVYMLPMIMLGVYYSADRGKTLFLSIAVGISILFQWYTAGINCLYSIFWFGMELFLSSWKYNLNFKEVISRVFRYLLSMFFGVMISLFIFWPNIIAMRTGKGSFDWNSLTLSFKGNILQSIEKYSIGSISTPNGAALFCGGLVLLGIIGFFSSKQFSTTEKKIVGIALSFSVLIFYWQPLFFLYSLLKSADSYWFRYSYVSIFCLIFIAGMYFSKWRYENNTNTMLKGAFIFSFILLGLKYISDNSDITRAYYTIIIIIGEAIILYGLKNNSNSLRKRRILCIVLVFFASAELFENGKILTSVYSRNYVENYKEYVKSEQTQIDKIKEMDNSFYRINQASTWNEGEGNLTANYNESMAFRYNGIASYTSSPQMIQLNMLDRMGYKNEYNSMSIVDTSIIPVDSLLGTKYILSKYSINGYREMNDMPLADGSKKVYVNPYALPIAFTVDNDLQKDDFEESERSGDNWNPFEYINKVYSRIMGEDIKIFKPVTFTVENDNGENVYHLSNIQENQTVYGNIPSRYTANALIDVNGIYTQKYSCWLSPTVFYIPSNKTADIKVTADDLNAFYEPQFYACDLNTMKEVCDTANSKASEIDLLANDKVQLTVNSASAGEKLLTSIPYNEGWTITINGQVVEPKKFAGALMQIPLSSGTNNIEFHYNIPGLKMGIAGSLIGILLLVVTQILFRRRDDNHQA